MRIPSSSGRPQVPRLPPGIRIYAVGDVHGCADLLTQVVSRIDTHLARNPVPRAIEVFLGDYVDRGPNSRGVIDLLIERNRSREMVLLKGNHEAYVLDFLKNDASLDDWRKYGGWETLLSYGLRPPLRPNPIEQRELAERFALRLPNDHLQFLSNLKPSFSCGDFFFVHAGIRPGVLLDQQREDDLLWIRDDFLLSEADFEKFIIHGHTPVPEPDIRSNRVNIDTGAFVTGRLTCLILENDEIQFVETCHQPRPKGAALAAERDLERPEKASQLETCLVTLAPPIAAEVEDANVASDATEVSQAALSATAQSDLQEVVSSRAAPLDAPRATSIKISTPNIWRSVNRSTLIVFAVAIVTVLIYQQLPSFWLTGGNATTSRAPDNVGQPLLGEQGTRSVESEPVLEPKLAFAPSASGVAGDDVALGVLVVDAANDSALEIAGLLPGMTLSAGRALGNSEWRIPIRDVPNARIHAPRDFVGAIDLTVVLRLPDDTVAEQASLHLAWSANPLLAESNAADRTAKQSNFAPAPRPPTNSTTLVASRPLNAEQVDFFIKRGEQLFAEGDLDSGRLLLKQAAEANDPRAYLALGATYDPVMLEILKLRGVTADVSMARKWYRIAKDLGSPEAKQRLNMLEGGDQASPSLQPSREEGSLAAPSEPGPAAPSSSPGPLSPENVAGHRSQPVATGRLPLPPQKPRYQQIRAVDQAKPRR